MEIARGRIGGLDLAENLGLADDERVESGGNAEQVAGRVRAAPVIQVFGDRRVRQLVVSLKNRPTPSAVASVSPTA